MQKVNVLVTLRENILDPTGKAVRGALQKEGFAEVQDVRVGKFIELTLERADEKRINEMCSALLANYVMEDYKIVRIEEAK